MSDLNPYDIEGQEEAKEKEQSSQKYLSDVEAEDFKWLMSDKRGRRFMWSLLEKTGLYRLSFVEGNSEATTFNEGTRNIGLMLLAKIDETCPDRFDQMKKEQNNVNRKLKPTN